MASTEEKVLRDLLGTPSKGTIGDLRKAYWNGMLAGTIGGGGGGGTTDQTARDAAAAAQTTANAAAPKASPTFTGTVSGVTKAMVGLTNVDNTADTAKPVSTAQQTAINLKANAASPAFTGTPTGLTKAHVGLANVDNTADVDKPLSTAATAALAGKAARNSIFNGTGIQGGGTQGDNMTISVSAAYQTLITGAVQGAGITNIVSITQAAYTALGSKVATTLYVIVG